jgi:zinc/manganese transport system substrate-binding protein
MRLAALFVAVVGLVGCTPTTAPPPPTPKLRVVATFSVLGEFVATVGDTNVEVTTLVGPDGDAHTFDPTPADAAKLAAADVIVENGAGFEGWLDKLVTSSGTKAKRVVATGGMTLIKADGGHETDPHVWHSVPNAMHMVEKVRDGLSAADPARAPDYKANAVVLLNKLKTLDGWVEGEVKKLPAERRKLVTSHDTFAYFAKRYGFTVVGTAIPSVSTAAADPSPAEFAKLASAIKTAGVPAIFAEVSHNPKLIERLAKEAGVKVAPPLFTDALGAKGSGGDTYEAMMHKNVDTIVAALKP